MKKTELYRRKLLTALLSEIKYKYKEKVWTA